VDGSDNQNENFEIFIGKPFYSGIILSAGSGKGRNSEALSQRGLNFFHLTKNGAKHAQPSYRTSSVIAFLLNCLRQPFPV